MNLREQITSGQSMLDVARTGLLDLIAGLPDNPHVKPVGKSTNAGIVSSKDFATSWSPSFHLWGESRRLLGEEVSRRTLESGVALLQEAAKGQPIQVGVGGSRHRITLHPELAEHLKKSLQIAGLDEPAEDDQNILNPNQPCPETISQ
jgi:hypothetical protein